MHPDDWEIYTGTHADLLAQRPTMIEYRLRGLDGVVRWVLERTIPRHRDERRRGLRRRRHRDHRAPRAVRRPCAGRLAEADEHAVALERARQAAETRARVDDLTGLHNRRHFTELLYRQVLRCGLTGDPVAVLMLDIDHFKAINDLHGHLVGDAALAAAASRLRQAIRPTDVLARWGGEEFVVLLPSVHDAETLQQPGRGAAPGDRRRPRSSVGSARRRHAHLGRRGLPGGGPYRRLGAARGGRPGDVRGQGAGPRPVVVAAASERLTHQSPKCIASPVGLRARLGLELRDGSA